MAEVDNEKIESDVISSSSEEILNAKDNGTFTALQKKIDNAQAGSTITLENDYIYDEGFDTEGIAICEKLTIDGNGHTIDALGKSRIFYISESGIVLNNITFCNGHAEGYDDGGAIESKIVDVKTPLLISNCSFINNSAGAYGGAVDDYYYDTVKIENCIFTNNSAYEHGGAISKVGDVVNCTFINNHASDGGAMSYVTNVVNCTFIINYAESGGAIYYINSYYLTNGKLENCSFVNNTAYDGGAVYTYTSQCKLVNCSFVNNTAYENGGAIYGGGIIDESEFVNNSAYEKGGAIYDSASIHESEFVNNSASWGGAIYTISFHQYSKGDKSYQSGHYIHADTSKFINNIADYGGAICIYPEYPLMENKNIGELILVDNIIFKNNSARVIGSALYLSASDFFMDSEFGDVSFINNHGTVIFIDEIILFDSYSCSYDMHKVYFYDNYGSNFNGAISFNDDIVSVKFYSSYTGKSHGYIGREEVEFDCIEGKVQFNVNDYNIQSGRNRIIVGIDDGTYYASVDFTITVESKVSIYASDVTKYCGGSEKYTLCLTEDGNPLPNKNVNVTVNGKTSTVKTDSNGQASVDLNLPVGEYDVIAVYEGVSNTSKVTVKSTIATADAVGTYLNSKVTATFLNSNGNALASKQVTFKVNGNDYTATTNSNGVATANIDLGVGNYTVTAVNPVNSEQKQFKLVINKASSNVVLAYAQSGGVTTLTATLTPAAATGSIIFEGNGENMTAAIKSGKATLMLSDLKAGNYTVTAVYNGDNNLNASTSNTITFNVSDVYPVLTANSVTKTYGTSTKLVVYLKDSEGKAMANAKVNVNINNKITIITTNTNGQATMEITQAPGTYYAKITYPGAKGITSKIVVKKATPKLTAKAKTFKVKTKIKKYTVTLKTNQNKVMKNTKLTLKVNGKTYSATTNAKGQATFKITKLTKKGKFTAVVKFAGNKYYYAKTVKPKITVK